MINAEASIFRIVGATSNRQLRRAGEIRPGTETTSKAGVMEGNEVTYPKEGTPQGGTISRLLSNIFLHYVLDEWFTVQIQPLLKGRSCLIRYADDFLLCFTDKEEALRTMAVLPKGLEKYGLTLHPDKTKLIELDECSTSKSATLDFLGFTHYMSNSRKGYPILKRKTSSKKLTMSLKRINQWLKTNRDKPVRVLIYALNQKLRGHYAYYGITFNSLRLSTFYERVKYMLYKWLNRKGGKPSWEWKRFTSLIKVWQPLITPKIYHSFN